MDEEQLKYPIGKFNRKETYTIEDIKSLIQQIGSLPERLEEAVQDLSPEQLDTPYRDGGWTVRQVVHHLADSHLNAYVRMKWTLTESTPTIKAYDEKGWAQTPEVKLNPVLSLDLLKALHIKWTALMLSLDATHLSRSFQHPETGKLVRLDTLIALYAWHGEHHLAHITRLKERKNWA